MKAKDKVIEELKKWLDVQEDTMNKQDSIISERDEQISLLQEGQLHQQNGRECLFVDFRGNHT